MFNYNDLRGIAMELDFHVELFIEIDCKIFTVFDLPEILENKVDEYCSLYLSINGFNVLVWTWLEDEPYGNIKTLQKLKERIKHVELCLLDKFRP